MPELNEHRKKAIKGIYKHMTVMVCTRVAALVCLATGLLLLLNTSILISIALASLVFYLIDIGRSLSSSLKHINLYKTGEIVSLDEMLAKLKHEKTDDQSKL